MDDLNKTEFGDYQTPNTLALKICRKIAQLGIQPHSIVEPTCGKGSFLMASEEVFTSTNSIEGYDVNPNYVAAAESVVSRSAVKHGNFLP